MVGDSIAGSLAFGGAPGAAGIVNNGTSVDLGGAATGGTSQVASAVFEEGPLMHTARLGADVITLQDGRVLLVGGNGTGFVSLDSAELLDPKTNTFTTIPMQSPRSGAAIQKLADGRYLIAGGGLDLGNPPGYQTAELFDPKALTFQATGKMVRAHMLCDATRLPDGRVLIVGGSVSDSGTYGEIYDPSAGNFVATGALNTPRAIPILIPTADGRVAVMGGIAPVTSSNVTQVEVYNPDTNSFTRLRDNLIPSDPSWNVVYNSTNARPAEQRLSDGRYLLMGYSGSSTTPLVFDPETLDVTRLEVKNQTGGPPLLDSSREVAYMPVFSTGQLSILRLGIRAPSSVLLSVAGYNTSYNPDTGSVTLIDPTRLWFAGGTTCSGSRTYFCPVQNTFFVRLVSTLQ